MIFEFFKVGPQSCNAGETPCDVMSYFHFPGAELPPLPVTPSRLMSSPMDISHTDTDTKQCGECIEEGRCWSATMSGSVNRDIVCRWQEAVEAFERNDLEEAMRLFWDIRHFSAKIWFNLSTVDLLLGDYAAADEVFIAWPLSPSLSSSFVD